MFKFTISRFADSLHYLVKFINHFLCRRQTGKRPLKYRHVTELLAGFHLGILLEYHVIIGGKLFDFLDRNGGS